MAIAEKYRSWPAYGKAWATRFALRSLLRLSASWQPMIAAEEGYTIVVGVPWQMWDLVEIPLLSLERARRERCAEVILALDATEPEFRREFGEHALQKKLRGFAALCPRVLFYNRRQECISRLIRWNWVDCWMTWVIGLAAARTRFALLHDFDAVVADPGFLEDHYQAALDGGARFVGIMNEPAYENYHGSVVLPTIELLFDLESVRARFSPVHLFNRVRMYDGARIECDILRDVQLHYPVAERLLRKVPETDIIHPHQMISEWHKLRNCQGAYRPSGFSPLLLIPYFRHAVGDDGPMLRWSQSLAGGCSRADLDGRQLDISELDQPGRDWAAKQVRRLDVFFNGTVSPAVERYCRCLERVGEGASLQPALAGTPCEGQ